VSPSDDATPTTPGDLTPPPWDAPPQPPAWDRPATGQPGWSGSGSAAAFGSGPNYGGPPGYGPPPGYGAPYGGSYGNYGGPAQTETKAIVALVLAIGSWVILPLLPAIAALFVARAAVRDIDLSMGRLGGRGMVAVARIVSWVNIALCVAGVLFLALFVVMVGAASSA
jgi:hypothetical protein